MRILFATTGGAGHVLPLRPLAQALRDRGHAVAWATAPDALPLLNEPGFERFAVGPTFDVSRSAFRDAFPDAGGLLGEALSAYTFPRLFGAILAQAMLSDVEQVVTHWQPDCVVHEPAALAVPLVCRHQGLLYLAHGYGLRPPAQQLAAAMAWIGPHWRARGLPVPADGGLYRHGAVDIAPAALQPVPDRPEAPVFRFNPYRPDNGRAASLPAALGQALQGPSALRPRLYLTFGTVFNRSPALLAAARAAARLGATLVVTVGTNGDPDGLAGLPGHVHVLHFVAQQALLPHCDAVVSHGGAGTVLAAAAHGLPQLLLPQAADHFRNARALRRAGSGAVIEPEDQTVDRVEAALRSMLSSRAMAAAAQHLALEMARLPDAATTARCVEQWHANGGKHLGPLRRGAMPASVPPR